MTLTKRNILWLAIAAFGMLLLVGWGRYSYDLICANCGSVQKTTEWQIPMTGITYWRSSSITPTPLSKVIANNKLALDPSHKWIFASGRGNGVSCAIGGGRHLSTAVYSEEVSSFVDGVARFQNPHDVQQWVTMLLDPTLASGTANRIRGLDIPTAGFPDKQTFERWWHDHHETLTYGME